MSNLLILSFKLRELLGEDLITVCIQPYDLQNTLNLIKDDRIKDKTESNVIEVDSRKAKAFTITNDDTIKNHHKKCLTIRFYLVLYMRYQYTIDSNGVCA